MVPADRALRTIRPGLTVRPMTQPPPVTVLEAELQQEMGSALGRAGRRLEAAVAALAQADPQSRATAVTEARDAFWCLLVQRDAVGLRDGAAAVIAAYDVPPEVHTGLVVERPPMRRRPR